MEYEKNLPQSMKTDTSAKQKKKAVDTKHWAEASAGIVENGEVVWEWGGVAQRQKGQGQARRPGPVQKKGPQPRDRQDLTNSRSSNPRRE